MNALQNEVETQKHTSSLMGRIYRFSCRIIFGGALDIIHFTFRAGDLSSNIRLDECNYLTYLCLCVSSKDEGWFVGSTYVERLVFGIFRTLN